ncbi:MAG: Succinate dehydrogenase cytochrome b558 subunit [Chlamydiales bacterium]|nr:Succinate dehydrogenase cytochrome b558 subunit [Chlamydiales bacterium]
MTTPVKERSFESDEKLKLPRPFILRRVHSLLGIWLVIYLFEHLLVNSQAPVFFDDDGNGFVSMVNQIHSLPYLPVIEILFLGLPFLIHGVWGVFYALTSKGNAHRTDGTNPALPQYKRNRAYSWQRITSWLLLIGIVAHVIQMRFVENPTHVQDGDEQFYVTRLVADQGLEQAAEKFDVHLYSRLEEGTVWYKAVEHKKLKPGQVWVVASNAGSAFLLIVRETFKSPVMVILYSILVIAAVYHAFNGLWTAMISWGITLTRRSQKRMRLITSTLMGVVLFLGLLSVWGTYLSMKM